MKTKGLVALISLVLCLPSGLKSSAQEPPAALEDSILSLSPQMLYSEILAYLQDGSVLFGFFTGIEPDALIVRKDGQDISMSWRSLKKIILKTDTNLNRNMLYGMAAGLYAGNLFLLRGSYQPFAFARKLEDRELWFGFIYEPIFAACGIGLGYLATLLEKGEKVFDFGATEETQTIAWDKFRGFAAGVPQPAKIHFSLHGGSVLSGFSSNYDDLLREAGYQSYYGASRTNLLRRFQVTYSLTPALEFGLAYVSVSEPGSFYNYYSADSHTSLSLSLEPKYTQNGYYLVGAFRSEIGRKVTGNIGLGAGAAKATLVFTGYLDRMEYVLDPVSQGYWTWITTEFTKLAYKDTKAFISGFVFAEVSVRLYKNLYLGISGDYLLKHADEVPTFQDFRVPARKVRLGNASIGFTMGWHF